MPTETGLCSASVNALDDTRTPAFASANNGRITKLVHGRSRCSTRASGATASSGTEPRRRGIGAAGVRSPTTTPASAAGTPDAFIASHTPTPSPT